MNNGYLKSVIREFWREYHKALQNNQYERLFEFCTVRCDNYDIHSLAMIAEIWKIDKDVVIDKVMESKSGILYMALERLCMMDDEEIYGLREHLLCRGASHLFLMKGSVD